VSGSYRKEAICFENNTLFYFVQCATNKIRYLYLSPLKIELIHMLTATTVTTEKELGQIHQLNQQSLRQNLDEKEKKQEGFVTWLYSMELLRQMHELEPSIIVKDKDEVIAYALVTPREAGIFHHDLKTMVDNLQTLSYNDKPLNDYSWYVMGQVCIDKFYRGKGVFNMLYQKHKELYGHKYDLLVTEISVHNPRSLRAHEKVGFKIIHTYHDALDEWAVVVWDWRAE